ncbi:hypothetical protein PVK06_034783 [Gossypium arboreum]|uniref:Uncharacterized protein n=1 Tax=Gossypium arboreum TaxID=29729 RepID=A0ABR0NF44_GOSAR|nr:hypothetical protein PVK06_034783 [Gossypium arboreum]
MQNEEGTEVVNTKNLNPNIEIEHSQSPIEELESRKLTFERKLLELHSLKEKLSCIAYLQKDLTGKTAEIGKLNFTISALKAEIKDLQEIISKKKFVGFREEENYRDFFKGRTKRMREGETGLGKKKMLDPVTCHDTLP